MWATETKQKPLTLETDKIVKALRDIEADTGFGSVKITVQHGKPILITTEKTMMLKQAAT